MRVKLRALIFDLDGTVVDSGPAICGAASSAFARMGHTVSAADVRVHLGAPLSELCEIFVPGASASDIGVFTQHYIAEHDAHPEVIPRVYDGATDALRELAAAMPLGIATTKPTLRARDTLDRVALTPLFHHVQGTDPPMLPKPAPDVLVAAMRGLSVDAADTVFVGDTARDVHAAKALGVRAALITHDGAPPCDAPADLRFAGFGALMDFVFGFERY